MLLSKCLLRASSIITKLVRCISQKLLLAYAVPNFCIFKITMYKKVRNWLCVNTHFGTKSTHL